MDKVIIENNIFLVELIRNTENKFSVEVVRRKHLKISAPEFANTDEIKNRILRKSSWILNQDSFLNDHPVLLPKRKYITGESFYLLGEQYSLVVSQGDEAIRLSGRKIFLVASSQEHAKSIFNVWFTSYAQSILEKKFADCLNIFKAKLGVEVTPRIMIRKMKNRWGSCTPNNLITLNTELVAAKISCIEYVIYHELTHTLHLYHSENFYDDLAKVCPNHEELKRDLDRETQLVEE